ncbi:MAG: hypothetical protein K0S20_222 [Patescibacteria group bacterium]|jgi:hypothetical protein|nr:hypothetical protein [Patescibacteria group bacterium]
MSTVKPRAQYRAFALSQTLRVYPAVRTNFKSHEEILGQEAILLEQEPEYYTRFLSSPMGRVIGEELSALIKAMPPSARLSERITHQFFNSQEKDPDPQQIWELFGIQIFSESYSSVFVTRALTLMKWKQHPIIWDLDRVGVALEMSSRNPDCTIAECINFVENDLATTDWNRVEKVVAASGISVRDFAVTVL